jgi:transposase-like protein
MDTSDHGIVRRRLRTHSAEFKAKVVSACRQPGVSIAAVALANGLNANLLRRWVVTEEQTPPLRPMAIANAALPRPTAENRTFIPIELERSALTTSQGNHDRAAPWRDGREGRLAVGSSCRMRGLAA